MILPNPIAAYVSRSRQRGEQIKGHCTEGKYFHCWKFPSYNPKSRFDFQMMETVLMDPRDKRMALSITQIPNSDGHLEILTSKHEYKEIKSFCYIREEKYTGFNFGVVNFTKADIEEFYQVGCKSFYRVVHEKYIYDPISDEVTALKLREPDEIALNTPGYFPELPKGPADTIAAAFALLNQPRSRQHNPEAVLRATFQPPPEALQAVLKLSEAELIRDAAGKIIDVKSIVDEFVSDPKPEQSVFLDIDKQETGIYTEMYAEGTSPGFKYQHMYRIKKTAEGHHSYVPILSQICTTTDINRYLEIIIEKKSGWLVKKHKRIHIIKPFSESSQSCRDVKLYE